SNRDPTAPVVAYFDLDRTLISGYSITALALEKMWSGLSPRRMLIHIGIFLEYGLGRSDYHGLLQATVGALAGRPEREMIDLGARAFERRLSGLIYDEARQLIAAHQSRQHEVVIITSATRYQAAPVAEALGVEQLLCTELEIDAGVITGNVTPCYGDEKLSAAVRFGQQQGAGLESAFFYSDSEEDLPLLDAVGRPVAVNAKPSLSRIATERGWPQLVFAQQSDGAAIAA
ncbi:MAG: HAD family hydrolase, partial [Pseudomonadales bacterium]|nr:HAD family hydrolase [Pseudomonadales bacterium]